MTDLHKPRCPRCQSKRVAALGDGTFRCSTCDTWFDADPDEGGDYSSFNPAARLEREERKRKRK
jgi:ribosomal protein L37AE/L43A